MRKFIIDTDTGSDDAVAIIMCLRELGEGQRRYIAEMEGMEQSLDAASQVLTQVSKLPEENGLRTLILENYQLLLNGESLHALWPRAQKTACGRLRTVI